MVRAGGEHWVANKPFDQQVKAQVVLQFAQRPVEEILDQKGTHQVGNGMRWFGTGAADMMKGGAGLFQVQQVNLALHFDQQVVGIALEQFGVGEIAEPVQERVQVSDDQRERKIGYNVHGGLCCTTIGCGNLIIAQRGHLSIYRWRGGLGGRRPATCPPEFCTAL